MLLFLVKLKRSTILPLCLKVTEDHGHEAVCFTVCPRGFPTVMSAAIIWHFVMHLLVWR